MSENKESKPRSFRIDDETVEKFKEISSKLGDGINKASQQQTLSKLIEAYEFQSGKIMLEDKRADIEQFEKYISCLTNMYMSTLENNRNITETVRTEFEALLKSKDTTIQDLQSQLTTAKQLKEESTSKAKMYADENSRLNGVIESLNDEYNSKMDDMQAMLADKDNLNKALTDSCNSLKTEAEGLREAAEQTVTLRSELEQLRKEHDKTTQAYADLQKQLKQEQVAHEKAIADLQQHEADALERAREQSQLVQDKAVLKLERKYQEQIQKLKAENQAEVDKYQQKYFELLEQLKNQTEMGE